MMENENEKARLFVAVELPQNMRDALADFCANFSRKKLFSGRCTRPENFHLTLKFLGEISNDVAAKVDSALKNISFQPFDVRFGSFDVLPTREKIRILFVHLICPELPLLATQIEEDLEFHFERESRPFKSHVTVARIKSIQTYNYAKFLKEIDTTLLPEMAWKVDSFVLKKSVLTQDGPIYETISRYDLI